MSLKLYTDAHIAKQIAVQLKQRGVDILRCQDVGMTDDTDEAHLEFATNEGRTIVSFDADFLRLHSQWQEQGQHHAGVIHLAHRLQGTESIGRIVTELYDYYLLIQAGAGTVEEDIADQVKYIR